MLKIYFILIGFNTLVLKNQNISSLLKNGSSFGIIYYFPITDLRFYFCTSVFNLFNNTKKG